MCGFTGFWRFSSAQPAELEAVVRDMTLPLADRGPDSDGFWQDAEAGLALGHRRLKIVDLSPAGHQPMLSRSERYVLVYNGELYNAQELRKQLDTYGSFRGMSDTEVLIEAISLWGVPGTCQRLLGMFAFAVWDRQTRTLSLVRDRLGVKPLYWGFQKEILFFGSQIKSFMKHPQWQPSLDQKAITAFFEYGYIPAPLSIFEGIYKLMPGHILTIDAMRHVEETTYWDPQNLPTQELLASQEEVQEKLHLLLQDAVKRRMVADVPLGAFLSGGIDSSLVVALMQKASPQPIRTFSIGFLNKAYNEAPFAEAVAQHLGTQHQTLMVTEEEAFSTIHKLPEFYDEPFADSSGIPTYLISQFAEKEVKVALSGDGGDEMFAGYNRYLLQQRLSSLLKHLPKWLKRSGGYALQQVPEALWDMLGWCCPRRLSKLRTASRFLLMPTETLYHALVSVWPKSPLRAPLTPLDPPFSSLFHSNPQRDLQTMQLIDVMTYLPDDVLTKVDRASMAVGLEVRSPLLDHRLMEFAWRLPCQQRIHKGQTKWLLRKILYQYVPRQLIERPKMGFGVPLADWLHGPLKEWASDLLSDACASDFFDTQIVQRTWKRFLTGKEASDHKLWTILMFETWRQHYKIR